ncbi:BlaI/MecI/CopY family transcriptional regulator [Tomitella biformata]|uniref:BlaI/MecI/CopY family transcriptional regulator n=1 Tax=Tomitella biformata TaxID=630403 RepID=UPI0004677CB6|nr:BlaI/MecI/CopY family transcriptional regulator [Tomitella biformata]
MRGLGDLEAAIMDVLWHEAAPLNVRGVLARLKTDRVLAYTTVMTVLDNLHSKEWVTRELVGKAYYYRPMHTKAEAAANLLRKVLDDSGDPQAVLLHFTQTASEVESAMLRNALRKKRSRP